MTPSTIEISITPPGASGTWWTIFWNGTEASVEAAPGLDGDTPEDWGVNCTDRAYTDPWRAEGGTPYVVEQILDTCASAGARAEIIAVRGDPETRRETLAALTTFAHEHPECAPELRRFVAEIEERVKWKPELDR